MGFLQGLLLCVVLSVTSGARLLGNDTDAYTEEEAALTAIARRSVRFTTKIYDTFRDFDSMVASPLCAEALLALLYLGSTNRSAGDVAAALDIPRDRRACRRGYRALTTALTQGSGEQTAVKMATRVFVDRNFPTIAGFLGGVTADFLASTRLVDFRYAQAEATNAVNRWVCRRVRRRIKRLVFQGSLARTTRVVFANTLFLDGRWQTPFPTADTQTATFHVSPKKQMSVPMMRLDARLNYTRLEDHAATAVELPFKGRRASMVILLPDSREGLFTLESQLQEHDFGTVQCTSRGRVRLALPKFEMNHTINYNGHIRQLHIHDIFNSVLVAGVARPRSNVKVADVVQKTYVRVDERGATAASATSEPGKSNCCENTFMVYQKTKVLTVSNRMMMMGPEDCPVVLEADHPFVFFLKDKKTNTILFVGRYLGP